jgi:hypothetical protein
MGETRPVAIIVDKNTQYGGTLVTQKYAPLLNIQFVQNDQAVYSALLQNRANLLHDRGLWTRTLRLTAPDWTAMQNSEAGHLPPLVVISSNRSIWIADGIRAANAQAAALALDPPFFTGVSDWRALTASAGQTQSPPIYAPIRLGQNPNRNVYVVVQASEHKLYKSNLAALGVTVIGWEFKVTSANSPLIMTGFGASRYAAIEFCKYLRAHAPQGANQRPPWDYAWLLDDNVVMMGSFPNFTAAEQLMTANHVAAGFNGSTRALAFSENRDWARNPSRAAPPPLPVPTNKGIIQQASLWNIDYMVRNSINFSPIFLASAEDLSIGKYFDTAAIPYRWWKAVEIRKEAVGTYDNQAGAQRVQTGRNLMAAMFAAAEAGNPAQPVAALPLNVEPSDTNDGGVQILAPFVTNRVLPNSIMSGQAADVNVQNTAKCQAVEQMTAGALGEGLVTAQARTATFSTANNAASIIRPVNRP